MSAQYKTGRWEQIGKCFAFRAIIMVERIFIHAAIVKPKNDGRWNWFRKKSIFLPERAEPLQGVCATLEEAQAKALEDLP